LQKEVLIWELINLLLEFRDQQSQIFKSLIKSLLFFFPILELFFDLGFFTFVSFELFSPVGNLLLELRNIQVHIISLNYELTKLLLEKG